MKFIIASCLALLSHSVSHAVQWDTTMVECSKVKQSNTTSFQACATTSFSDQRPFLDEDGQMVALGGFYSNYRMTVGLKKGVDVATLSDSARNKAYQNGIDIQVGRYDEELCVVTVTVKGKSSECKSCQHCGNDKYTVDCTNVAHGRKTKCESAKGSETVGQSKVFFPLKKAALSRRLR